MRETEFSVGLASTSMESLENECKKIASDEVPTSKEIGIHVFLKKCIRLFFSAAEELQKDLPE